MSTANMLADWDDMGQTRRGLLAGAGAMGAVTVVGADAALAGPKVTGYVIMHADVYLERWIVTRDLRKVTDHMMLSRARAKAMDLDCSQWAFQAAQAPPG